MRSLRALVAHLLAALAPRDDTAHEDRAYRLAMLAA